MIDEISELLEASMYKEVAANAFYSQARKNTDDPGAKKLLSELAKAELKHLNIVKELKQDKIDSLKWHSDKAADLKTSDYFTGGDKLENAGLQDIVIFAIKQEQMAIEFYSQMMSVFRSREAKKLCLWLVHEEMKHKLKLESFHDDFLYSEDYQS